MYNRLNETIENCDHFNFIPAWFVTSNIYIFWCPDCKTFILKDFNIF